MAGKAARNERRKIAATFFNNLAVSFIVTGLVVPAVALTYQSIYPQARFWWVFTIFWFTAGASFHMLSQRILGRIEE